MIGSEQQTVISRKWASFEPAEYRTIPLVVHLRYSNGTIQNMNSSGMRMKLVPESIGVVVYSEILGVWLAQPFTVGEAVLHATAGTVESQPLVVHVVDAPEV